MRTHRLLAQALILAILPLMLTSLATAGVYSDVVVYGDSLSDNGNLFAFDKGTYPPTILDGTHVQWSRRGGGPSA